MKINVFEGTRRIVKLIGVLWAIGLGIYFWTETDKPQIELLYAVEWPDERLGRVITKDLQEQGCIGGDSLSETVYRSTTQGTQVRTTICLLGTKAFPFDPSTAKPMAAPNPSDYGAVPVGGPDPAKYGAVIDAVDPAKTDSLDMKIAERLKKEVKKEVIAETVAGFRMSKSDEEWADSQYWPARWKQILVGVGWIVGGWVIVWLLSFVIGWIVRGFAGIPLGKDQRPEG